MTGDKSEIMFCFCFYNAKFIKCISFSTYKTRYYQNIILFLFICLFRTISPYVYKIPKSSNIVFHKKFTSPKFSKITCFDILIDWLFFFVFAFVFFQLSNMMLNFVMLLDIIDKLRHIGSYWFLLSTLNRETISV